MDRYTFWRSVMSEIGRGCMGMGGFEVDDQGNLLEEYAEDEEDWPEEAYGGDESEDCEDIGWSDCVWSNPECSRS